MNDFITRVEECRVCGSNNWVEVVSLGAAPLANGLLDPDATGGDEPSYPVDVITCRRCWLMSLRHVVDASALFTHYVYLTSDSDMMTRHMTRIVDWCVEKVHLADGDLVVELGSNIGTQLGMFKDRGLRTIGVDPARNLAEVANAAGIETIGDFFGPKVTAGIRQDRGTAALVLGRQCFAHIDDVHNILRGVEEVLAPDGVLAIEVPYLVDLLNENQFDTIYHEHLSYYSLSTLTYLFKTHGLDIVDAERADVHGGSIIVFASRAALGRRPERSVTDLLALEEQMGLHTERPYLEFADRTRKVVDEIARFVKGFVADGKRVAAYGAPSKGSALLLTCGLGGDELEFCIDTTPLKQGKLLPGTHIPVVSPEQGSRNHPDYYLLLAWNYAAEIITKERAFIEGGGRFIVPIPQPRLVASPDEL